MAPPDCDTDMAFQDHFSTQAATYAAARPTYPDALFAWLAQACPRHELAWDAGAGNGQCAVALSPTFARVIATEPSAAQLANAVPRPNIAYRQEAAESPSLAEASVDLLTIAQALHWFDLARFWPAARRVLREGALVAAWTYERCSVTPAVDAVFQHLYVDLLDPYWPPERAHVADGYARLPFPFARIPVPAFDMAQSWTLPQYLAYLSSWSATQRCIAATGRDPIAEVAVDMGAAWGNPDQPRTVRWPLVVHAGHLA